MKVAGAAAMLATIQRTLEQAQFSRMRVLATAGNAPPQGAPRTLVQAAFTPNPAVGTHLLVPVGSAHPAKKKRLGAPPAVGWLMLANVRLAPVPTLTHCTDMLPVLANVLQFPATSGNTDGVVDAVILLTTPVAPVQPDRVFRQVSELVVVCRA